MPLLEFLIQIKIDFTNTNLLKRRTSSVEQETEAKRQIKRSAKTNARKSAKQTRDRFQRKMKEVMKLLSKGKFTKDMKKEGNTTCLQDINTRPARW
jgi:predicted nucleotide-binding protein (sugar kinase/HSP70/actin superfamily)